MLDLVVTGGQVVTPQGVADMDVGVQGEKIVALAGRARCPAVAARSTPAARSSSPAASSRTLKRPARGPGVPGSCPTTSDAPR